MVAFPSIYPEAFGIVGIEAMMRGKPVVAFDTGGVRDWLTHNQTGLLVPVKDIRLFAESLIRLLGNSLEREEMGKTARKEALRKFHPHDHLEKITEIYQSACQSLVLV